MTAGIGLVSVLAVAGVLAGHRPTEPQETNLRSGQNNPLVGPCNGTEIAPSRVAESVPFTPYKPHDPLANASNESRAWSCPGDDAIIAYRSGVKVEMGPNTMRDPQAAYAVLAAKYPGEMEIGEARGRPALIANIYPETGAVGGISVVEGDVRLIVNGNGKLPIADLRRVLESLRQE